MRTDLRRATLAATALALAGPAFGSDVEVAQESAPGLGDFDANVLGTIAMLASDADVAAYYAYDTTVTESYGGVEPAPVDRRSYLFVHRSSGDCGTALVALHDQANSPAGGSFFCSVELLGDPDGAAFLVKDDPDGVGTVPDQYTGSPGSSSFAADQGWQTCCTDGWAIGPLDGPWETRVEITQATIGIDGWFAYSATGAELPLDLTAGRRVRLRLVSGGASESSRVGSPPNPDALLPGQTSGPVIGSVWDPVVDHTSFLPSATLDLLGVSVNPLNVALPPFGTLLCDPTILITVQTSPAGVPFAVPLPLDCASVGVTFCAQGASLDAAGSLRFANALDITIGTY
ncbi:MAG: hypothetical protein AAF682_21780 [Planctomycetota bacterium]